jgi:predicted DNA-binding ribbon-helix-helix protein
MKSALVNPSVLIAGHKATVRLEDAFWDDLRQIARGSHLVTAINADGQLGNLSSTSRLVVLGLLSRARAQNGRG